MHGHLHAKNCDNRTFVISMLFRPPAPAAAPVASGVSPLAGLFGSVSNFAL